jgi:methyl-accepting chemotaxis protein
MTEFTSGNHQSRIAQKRSDEFGDLFTAFNEMAASVEEGQVTLGESDDEVSEAAGEAALDEEVGEEAEQQVDKILEECPEDIAGDDETRLIGSRNAQG